MLGALPFDSIVILGGSGYVGSSLVRELKGFGGKVQSPASAEIDLTSDSSVGKLVQCFSSNTAIVFSACISPNRGSTSEIFLSNIRMAHVLSEAIRKHAPAYLVYLSANGVYEDYQSPCLESVLPTPQSLYGMMHLSRELIVSQTCQVAGTPLMILRPGSIYGPMDLHDYYGPTRFMRTALTKGYIELYGGGEEVRDHVSIQDVIRVICLCLQNQTTGLLNVSSGHSPTFRQVASVIAKVLKNTVEIRSVPRLQGRGISHRHSSATKLLKTFPGLSPLSVDEALTSWQN